MPYLCSCFAMFIPARRADARPRRKVEYGGVSMTKPVVILVGADKGGVGKTTVSRTLLDYFAHTKFARALSTPKYREERSSVFIQM